MRVRQQFGGRSGWALWVAALFITAAFSTGVRELVKTAGAGAPRRALAKAGVPQASPSPTTPARSHTQVKSYSLDFAGDHSLNGATVIEQTTAGYAHYTVNLQLASGAEQSVRVAAPPGGLQIEMHDMTGDHVPNDVVLRPAMLLWPPTVLVNDGHDHFAVVVSGGDPGDFSSSEDLGSRPHNGQAFAFLRSSGFKAIHVPESKGLPVPRLQNSLLSPFDASFARGIEHVSSSGRAPPFVTSI